ncbi:hypothetical protein JMJ77_0005379, partial [Colletotrichum scovillei]
HGRAFKPCSETSEVTLENACRPEDQKCRANLISTWRSGIKSPSPSKTRITTGKLMIVWRRQRRMLGTSWALLRAVREMRFSWPNELITACSPVMVRTTKYLTPFRVAEQARQLPDIARLALAAALALGFPPVPVPRQLREG